MDEKAGPDRQSALSDIFLGRAGGNALGGKFPKFFAEVYAARSAKIILDHMPNRETVRAGDYVVARTREAFPHIEPVTIGLVGHDRPGKEIIAEYFRVHDGGLQWEFTGRCGYANDFAYHSAER